jgi:hypothetical protein
VSMSMAKFIFMSMSKPRTRRRMWKQTLTWTKTWTWIHFYVPPIFFLIPCCIFHGIPQYSAGFCTRNLEEFPGISVKIPTSAVLQKSASVDALKLPCRSTWDFMGNFLLRGHVTCSFKDCLNSS